MTPTELSEVGFTLWPMRDVHGYYLFVRLARVGMYWLVAHSQFNGPVGWACEVYSSKTEWDAGAFPVRTIGPETYAADLVRVLWRERLI